MTEALDRGMLQNLANLVDEATAELEQYEYAKALAKIESFFWDFCDNYVEAAKSRRYGDFGPEAARLGVDRHAAGTVGAAALAGAVPVVCHAKKCGRGRTPARCIAQPGRRAPS